MHENRTFGRAEKSDPLFVPVGVAMGLVPSIPHRGRGRNGGYHSESEETPNTRRRSKRGPFYVLLGFLNVFLLKNVHRR